MIESGTSDAASRARIRSVAIIVRRRSHRSTYTRDRPHHENGRDRTDQDTADRDRCPTLTGRHNRPDPEHDRDVERVEPTRAIA